MIPQDIEKRKELNKLIERGVELLREQEQLKEDLKQLKAEVEETIGKDFSKEYLRNCKVRYKTVRFQEDANKRLEIISELEILKKSTN